MSVLSGSFSHATSQIKDRKLQIKLYLDSPLLPRHEVWEQNLQRAAVSVQMKKGGRGRRIKHRSDVELIQFCAVYCQRLYPYTLYKHRVRCRCLKSLMNRVHGWPCNSTAYNSFYNVWSLGPLSHGDLLIRSYFSIAMGSVCRVGLWNFQTLFWFISPFTSSISAYVYRIGQFMLFSMCAWLLYSFTLPAW